MTVDSSLVVPHKLFVGGLPKNAGHEKLMSIAQRYGTVRSLKVIHNPGERSGAFAFITFTSEEAVNLMMKARIRIEGMLLDFRLTFKNKYMQQINRDTRKRKVYIFGFNRSTSKQDLTRLFSAFGSVTEVTLNKCYFTGLSRCSGYVVFEDEEIAQHICSLGQVQGVFVLPCMRRIELIKKERTDSQPFKSEDRGNKKLKVNLLCLHKMTPQHYDDGLRFNFPTKSFPSCTYDSYSSH